MTCRHCRTELALDMIDLGAAPPSNAYLTEARLSAPERYYPLRVRVCTECWLVQTEDFTEADQLFDADYAYYSSYSSSWVEHARRYVADMIARYGLGPESLVAEVASNDGYLLRHVRAAGIRCYGVEPTVGTAAAARALGIDIVQAFFGAQLADELVGAGRAVDLVAANNVLAHVPDINDFTSGFARLLKPAGVATFEFPHLLNLVEQAQFDTIYHEHYSYLSLLAVEHIFAEAGLSVFDVEELPTHGGSLRVHSQRADTGRRPVGAAVHRLRAREALAGMNRPEFYSGLQASAERIKDDLLEFLIHAKRRGERVVAYGAAAKGNTLLNFAGVRPDLVGFAVDRNPAKLGKFLPGSRIPIVDEARLRAERPDWVLILPWNLRDEIESQIAYVRAWGGRFVTAIPEVRTA